ncbi:hypothetical protein m07a_11110 [Bartonella schoenbuchensis m07a]|uniref:Right handed beta helix domain-containing protein n=1 Tax=Bartonella schoenbuchensis m07a TaxID=1094496 RepID=N6UDZ3_9HYPH|nr:hypothetical protein m07a_11110 [Bartonella schoenbuchensis m07a]
MTRADLTRVKITGKNKGTGVYAIGATGMVMTLDGVTVSKVQTGVVMGRGESLMISGSSRIEFMGDYGVYVRDTVTVELAETKITGGGKGTGVYAVGGTGNGTFTVALDGVDIEGVQMGVYMKGGKKLTMKRGSVDFTGNYGVGVYVGSLVTSAELTEMKVVGSGKGSTGVYAGGGKVVLEKVTFEAVEIGVTMLGNGTLRMEKETRISLASGGGIGVMVGVM